MAVPEYPPRRWRTRRAAVLVPVVVAVLAGCAAGDRSTESEQTRPTEPSPPSMTGDAPSASSPAPSGVPAPQPRPVPPPQPRPRPSPAPPPPTTEATQPPADFLDPVLRRAIAAREAEAMPADAQGTEVRLRPVSSVAGINDDEFGAAVASVLTDARGWEQAGFRFTFGDDAPFTILLAEPGEVDAACAPYETAGRYSCQQGPVVALNADRWREATASWPATLDDYRTMLVNHEVGHLLGQAHPEATCVEGIAPVMAQQSKGLGGCAANPWPLSHEIRCAAELDAPLAPGPGQVTPPCEYTE